MTEINQSKNRLIFLFIATEAIVWENFNKFEVFLFSANQGRIMRSSCRYGRTRFPRGLQTFQQRQTNVNRTEKVQHGPKERLALSLCTVTLKLWLLSIWLILCTSFKYYVYSHGKASMISIDCWLNTVETPRFWIICIHPIWIIIWISSSAKVDWTSFY